MEKPYPKPSLAKAIASVLPQLDKAGPRKTPDNIVGRFGPLGTVPMRAVMQKVIPRKPIATRVGGRKNGRKSGWTTGVKTTLKE